MNILDANEVVKDYTNHRALDNVSLSIPDKSIFGLLGPNGAGKTTLIRIINQITGADQGDVYFQGERLRRHHVERIGYLPEERGLYRKMKVGEMAIYLARLKGLSKSHIMEKLEYWFRKFDLVNWWDRKVEELSKGMQQKIQFIVTIIHDPDLLIFDEPFSGFDPINQTLLKDEILKQKERGAAIIFSTHNMASVEEICDNIALINKSRMILQGEVSELKEQYKSNEYDVVMTHCNKGLNQLKGHGFEIISQSPKNGDINARIRVADSIDNNKLIEELIDCGNIKSFSEVLPTMNEIFMKNVKEVPNE